MTMETTENPRRQLIEMALTQHPETVVQTTVRLWEQLAPELISIIGESGFRPLYVRSIRLTCKQHPWMAQDAAQPAAKERFTNLQDCLQRKDPMQAIQASMALLTIFLDVLASLIGEELTTHLLQSAWSNEASTTPAKNFPLWIKK